MKNERKLILALILILSTSTLSAQMTRKPSPTSEPRGLASKPPDSNKRYLSEIKSRKEFDLMARVYHQNTPYALPHAMFVIDRKKKNRIYYVNSQKYRFHKDFLIGNYMVLRGQNLSQDLYIKASRRFIVGTIAWQTPVEKFTFEYWEGDLIPASQIKLTYDIINKTFFDLVSFKPNSTRHDDLTAGLPIKRITSDDISKNQEYLAMNTAKAVGRVHIVDRYDPEKVEIGYNEILVLKEVPITLPPVRGIIIAKRSTPLSHLNLLAKSWGIPNAYIKDADKLFKKYDTWWVEFETTLTDYKIKRANLDALKEQLERDRQLGHIFKAPPSDLMPKELANLWQIRKQDSKVYGAKAANLGELKSAKIPNVIVPRGFAIPFSYYVKFLRDNGLDARIKNFASEYDFVHNPGYRRKKLKKFREEIRLGKFDLELQKKILRKWKTYLWGRGVFVRSSSNAEDMKGFSGAGLYETVPNVKDGDKIIEAVKTVWASLWNFEAYEARERNFIRHTETYMGILIQVGVNMSSSGVMITKDPFDRENEGAVYISAKRGLGIKVVDGKRIAEQILYSKRSNAVQILTRSEEDTLLTFDANGGVKEVPVKGTRKVLTDSRVRKLAEIGRRIKKVFGSKTDQDIEWGYRAGRIYILQSRPFVENNTQFMTQL